MAQTTDNKNNSNSINDNVFPFYLSDLVKGFFKFWWIIVILVVFFGGLMFYQYYVNYVPSYTASATFTVGTESSSSTDGGISSYAFYYDAATAEQLSTTFPYLLSSNLLQDAIREDLGISSLGAKLSASSVTGSNLFTITSTGSDPQNTYDVLISSIKNYPVIAKYVVGNIELTMITEPVMPTEPTNQTEYISKLINGVLIGLFLGLCFLILYAIQRRTIRTKDNIKSELNQSVLGTLPMVRFKQYKSDINRSVLLTNERVGNSFRENIRVLRNNFLHSLPDDARVVMITSTAPGEGKSTVITNIALSLSDLEKNVLLVDADLRNPSVMGLFNSTVDVIKPIQQTTAYDLFQLENSRLTVMILKYEEHRFFRSMNEDWLSKIFNTFKDHFDYILVDTPPCGLISDSLTVAQACDAAMYVILQDTVRVSRIRSGLENLMSTDIKILGCIENGTVSGSSGYGYGYGYGSNKYKTYGKYGYSYDYNYGYGYGYGSSKKSSRHHRNRVKEENASKAANKKQTKKHFGRYRDSVSSLADNTNNSNTDKSADINSDKNPEDTGK